MRDKPEDTKATHLILSGGSKLLLHSACVFEEISSFLSFVCR